MCPRAAPGRILATEALRCYLRTAHIGEVAVEIWPKDMERACAEAGIFLL